MEFHPLGLAARYNDAAAEEVGVLQAVADLGLRMSDVVYLAQQRAIRNVMIATGRIGELQEMYRTNKPRHVDFTEVEQAMIEQFALAILDAVCIGWKGHEIAMREEATE
jgi:hypothetical protein